MVGGYLALPTTPPQKKGQTVFKCFYHFIFQPAVYESSISSSSLSTLRIVSLFILAILDEYVVVSYFSFICISLMTNESASSSVVSDSLQPHGLYSPWNSPGQNTGMGSLALLRGIFSTQGSNPSLPQYRQILYHLSHQGSPLTPQPGIKPATLVLEGKVLTTGPPGKSLQVDSLPAEPQGKPKNAGVGSLSLLQRIFPTQESNQVSCIAGRFSTN